MSKAAAAIMIDSDDELSFRNDDDSDFSFDEKDTRKMPASFKKAAGTTKAASSKPSKKSAKAVEVVENVKAPAAVLKEKSVNKSKEKTIEETYQKKTQLEHILLRPDTYSKCLCPTCHVMLFSFLF
jgi:DNA topoisomerase-2